MCGTWVVRSGHELCLRRLGEVAFRHKVKVAGKANNGTVSQLYGTRG